MTPWAALLLAGLAAAAEAPPPSPAQRLRDMQAELSALAAEAAPLAGTLARCREEAKTLAGAYPSGECQDAAMKGGRLLETLHVKYAAYNGAVRSYEVGRLVTLAGDSLKRGAPEPAERDYADAGALEAFKERLVRLIEDLAEGVQDTVGSVTTAQKAEAARTRLRRQRLAAGSILVVLLAAAALTLKSRRKVH